MNFTLVSIAAIATGLFLSVADGQTSQPAVQHGPADLAAPGALYNGQFSDPVAWMDRHKELIARAHAGKIDLYFEGDSITDWWLDKGPYDFKAANFHKNFDGWNATVFGIGGDRIEHALYRMQNGELDDVNPKVVVLLIGTNNLGSNPQGGDDEAMVADIVSGVRACVTTIHAKAPQAKILLMGLFARNRGSSTRAMSTIRKINERLATLEQDKSMTLKFLDINNKLADETGKLLPGMMQDGLHPKEQGYQVWADAMKPILTEWLGPRPATQPSEQAK